MSNKYEKIIELEIEWCNNNHPENNVGFIRGLKQALLLIKKVK